MAGPRLAKRVVCMQEASALVEVTPDTMRPSECGVRIERQPATRRRTTCARPVPSFWPAPADLLERRPVACLVHFALSAPLPSTPRFSILTFLQWLGAHGRAAGVLITRTLTLIHRALDGALRRGGRACRWLVEMRIALVLPARSTAAIIASNAWQHSGALVRRQEFLRHASVDCWGGGADQCIKVVRKSLPIDVILQANCL